VSKKIREKVGAKTQVRGTKHSVKGAKKGEQSQQQGAISTT